MKRSNEMFRRWSISLKRPALRVGEFGDSHALASRGLDHLLAVLVGAGQEEHVLAVEPLKARQRIGRDRLIGVADMRHAVRIGDRGRDVEGVARAAAAGCCSGGSGLRRGVRGLRALFDRRRRWSTAAGFLRCLQPAFFEAAFFAVLLSGGFLGRLLDGLLRRFLGSLSSQPSLSPFLAFFAPRLLFVTRFLALPTSWRRSARCALRPSLRLALS